MSELVIGANGFALPLNAMTRRIVVLGQSDTGKTNTVTDLVEEVLEHHQQVVIFDYKGDFWGLQSSADGKKAGYSPVIFGGDHANIDLTEDSGVAIADVIVEGGFSAILDVSNLESKASIQRFVTAFAKRLFYQKRKIPTPMLLVLDEVDQVAPQRPFPGEQQMLGAIETLVRLGRKRGIGVAMTTQAPAVVSKNVLEQGDLYIFHQMAGKNAVKAIEEAVRRNATPEELEVISRGIGRLQRGETFVYSPAWLRILEPVKMRRRRTFDSSRTPEVGDLVTVPTARATPDIPALRAQIAASVERAKADDPKALQAQIAALERQLKGAPVAAPEEVAHLHARIDELERAQSDPDAWVRLVDGSEMRRRDLTAKMDLLEHRFGALSAFVVEFRKAAGEALIGAESGPTPLVVQRPITARSAAPERASTPAPIPTPPMPPQPPQGAKVTDTGSITAAHRKVLDAIAMRHPESSSRLQVGVLAGYSANSGNFKNLLGGLRTRGLIEYPRDGDVILTESGVELARDTVGRAPQDSASVIEMWSSRLEPAQSRVLAAVISAYPRSITRDDIGAATSYSPTSGNFKNLLGRLSSLGLVTYPSPGVVRASDDLFPTGSPQKGNR